MYKLCYLKIDKIDPSIFSRRETSIYFNGGFTG